MRVPEINKSNTDGIDTRADKSVALQRLLHAHAGQLLEYVEGKIPQKLQKHVDARDVLQDVFFKAFQHIGEFDQHGDNAFYRWLVTIARHRVLELIRSENASKRGGRRELFQDQEIEAVETMLEELAIYNRTPSQSAISHEVAVVVQKSMSRIEPQYREAIQMRYLDGVSTKESAARMGRSEGSVAMLCQRGLKLLRQQLVESGALAP